jgi:hypothetical protein
MKNAKWVPSLTWVVAYILAIPLFALFYTVLPDGSFYASFEF